MKFKDKAQILNNMARGKVQGKEKEKSSEGELEYSTILVLSTDQNDKQPKCVSYNINVKIIY